MTQLFTTECKSTCRLSLPWSGEEELGWWMLAGESSRADGWPIIETKACYESSANTDTFGCNSFLDLLAPEYLRSRQCCSSLNVTLFDLARFPNVYNRLALACLCTSYEKYQNAQYISKHRNRLQLHENLLQSQCSVQCL